MLNRILAAGLALPLTAGAARAQTSIDQMISDMVAPIVNPIVSTVFYSVPVFGTDFPLIVGWLVLAAVIFTFYFGFIQFRGFRHSISLVRGDYLDPRMRAKSRRSRHWQPRFRELSGWATSPVSALLFISVVRAQPSG